jgi:hypothetical protein
VSVTPGANPLITIDDGTAANTVLGTIALTGLNGVGVNAVTAADFILAA